MSQKAVLEFVFPQGVSREDIDLTLFCGYPTRQRYSVRDLIEKGLIREVAPREDGKYLIEKHGMYCYRLIGEGFYTVVKLFHVTEEEFLRGCVSVNVIAEEFSGEEGYQPCLQPDGTPEACRLHHRDKTLYLFPDEFLKEFSPILNKQYRTPAFTEAHAPHQFTTQEEMMDFLRNSEASFSAMKLFSLGKTI